MRTRGGRKCAPKPPYNISQREPPRVPERRIGLPWAAACASVEGGKDHRRATEEPLYRRRNGDSPETRISQTCWSSLGYQVRRVGSYHTTQGDGQSSASRTGAPGSVTQRASAETPSPSSSGSITKVSRRPWSTCLTWHGRARDSPRPSKHSVGRPRTDRRKSRLPLPCHSCQRGSAAGCLPISASVGIAPQVIRGFVEAGLLYEDAQHHNCVFVGRDQSGAPVFANQARNL